LLQGIQRKEQLMSDPRYTDPADDPRRTNPRDPMGSGPSRYNVEDDANRSGMWAWIVGIIAVIVIAMLVYDYNRPISTATGPQVNPPSTTGSAPAPSPPPVPAPKSP
jgi:hypothetical protein